MGNSTWSYAKFWDVDTLITEGWRGEDREITLVAVNDDSYPSDGLWPSNSIEGSIEYSVLKGKYEASIYSVEDGSDDDKDETVILNEMFDEYDVALRLVKSVMWKLIRMPNTWDNDVEASSWSSFDDALGASFMVPTLS